MRTTELEPSEAKHKELENDLKVKDQVIASFVNAVAVADLEGKLTNVNASFLKLWGYDDEKEILGKPSVEFWQAEGKAAEVVTALLEKGAWEGELVAKRKDGSVFDVRLSASTVTDKDGKPLCRESSFVDISDRKQVKEALGESEKRYRLLAENAADVIWTVDMNMRLTYISPSVTRLLGYSVEEAMAKPMEEVFTPASFEAAMGALAQELATENMEQKDLSRSRTLEVELNCKDGSLVPVELKCSFLRDSDGRPVEILAIARDISERKQAEEDAKRSMEKLVNAMEKTIQAMAMMVEQRDPHTAGHQRRVTQLACAIAKTMGLSEDQITGLRLAALIHDIGKVRVPSEILTNPNGLSEAEFSMIKMHPLVGYEILKDMELPWPIAQIVHQHHERMDGSGYPSGLSGEDITLEARILAVADVVEAIASHRPYREALGLDAALEEISQNRGVLYDPKVVDACLKLFREKEFELE